MVGSLTTILLRPVKRAHLVDEHLVVLCDVRLCTCDDVRRLWEALPLIAQTVAQNIEGETWPVDIHRMPHLVYGFVRDEDFIFF